MGGLVSAHGTVRMTLFVGLSALIVGCGGGGGGDTAPTKPDDDGSTTDTAGDSAEGGTGETEIPGFTGDPADGVASGAAVIERTFAPHQKVATHSDDSYFYVESDGIPEHPMMVNITAWIAQVPVPHPYAGDNAWSIPVRPVYADDPVSIETDLQRGALAIAANGIPIFNPINASGDISQEIGELDDFGGHSGRADDYHYHAAPLHLETVDHRPIAYAFDGFPIYGALEPDGSSMRALDEFHGHEAEDGTYHYHGTDTYPFMVASLRGAVALDPMTSAPQTQIVPQARTVAFRDPPHPIPTDDLRITELNPKSGGSGYVLEYEIGGEPGSVDYEWNDDDEFTFVFHDVDGSTTTERFQRGEAGGGAGPDGGGPAPDATTDTAGGEVADTPGFELTSPAVVDGALLDEFKCERRGNDGSEDSIPLAWSGVPVGTGALAISMHHYPNPNDTDPARANQYLVLWGIDPSVTEIAHGGADDGDWFMGPNKDGVGISYTSPCSQNPGSFEYTIRIYALSETPASLPQGDSLEVSYAAFLAALEQVTIVGRASLTFVDASE